MQNPAGNKKSSSKHTIAEGDYFTICGHLCGQNFLRNLDFPQKLQKPKENSQKPNISGVSAELLGGFEVV